MYIYLQYAVSEETAAATDATAAGECAALRFCPLPRLRLFLLLACECAECGDHSSCNPLHFQHGMPWIELERFLVTVILKLAVRLQNVSQAGRAFLSQREENCLLCGPLTPDTYYVVITCSRYCRVCDFQRPETRFFFVDGSRFSGSSAGNSGSLRR